MTESYQPEAIESRWQQKWDETQLYRSVVDWEKPKHYALTMLPYPSGDLHIGHWFAMTPSDARARWMRMRGYNVMFPMGFDAFGLPAEQAAISRNIHPWKWTYANIERMQKQMRSMGAMFDWEREAISCTPEYYKWTEWFFKVFYENDLAYRDEALVNWSEALQTVLANEQVIDGKDERLGQPVVQKLMTQWFFSITKYADELLNFDNLDWPEPIKIMQTNWIGRSEGAKVTFKTASTDDDIVVFTTRPDTLWGATFMVLAPEHDLVDKITTDDQREAVEAYREAAANATEIERLSEDREKSGVFTGAYAVNPVNQKQIPIWIADYVMISYGTGAIMAVPYGDQRDFEFARHFGLDIVTVVQPDGVDEIPVPDEMDEAYAGPGTMVNSGPLDGIAHNGEKGRKSPAVAAAIDYLEERGIGEETVNYRLRDWLISRQRYWGSPIPMIHRQDGSVEPVPDSELPVELPEDVEFMPTGRSPLTYHEPFLNTTDSDGNPARRETDTMDTFMCSSWYQLRYLSPHFNTAPFDPEEAAYWLPVDVYTGGAEHAVMHLLYTRFFTKALRDTGVFDDAIKVMQREGRDPEGLFDEPMTVLRNQGQVLGGERLGDYVLCSGSFSGDKLMADRVEVVEWAEVPAGFEGVTGELTKRVENTLFVGPDNSIVEVAPDAEVIIPSIEGENNVNQLKHHLEIQRMSKSKGNVVNPDELVDKYGADTVRAYLMFNFDWQKGGPWNENNIKGPAGWINDVWDIVVAGAPDGAGNADVERDVERKLHQAIAEIDNSLDKFSFNKAIADQMKFKNFFRDAIKAGDVGAEAWAATINVMLRLMAPFTPHVAEELWARMGWEYSVHQQPWPEYDEEKAAESEVPLVIMINGKPRGTITVAAGIAQADAEKLVLASDKVKSVLNGDTPNRVIFIPGDEPKVNIVVGGKKKKKK
ncbi:MAG: leucine--tRNA ligase [Anaerolineaceae bacterium]|nr:leucine--tRNA ligase [Anaerolineaceae bacterium]